MCGRYNLITDAHALMEAFEVVFERFDIAPRYNIAPGQDVLAIRWKDNQRQACLLRWGLIPCWAKDSAIGYKTINARAETVATKPAYRSAFKEQRCLIVASGFYEWQPVGKIKQPYHIRMRDQRPFAFAGLWDEWTSKETGEHIASCTVLVTDANAFVGTLHDRMPVILSPDNYDAWLKPDTDLSSLQSLLIPYPGDDLEMYPVSRAVNSAKNEGPELLEPVALS